MFKFTVSLQWNVNIIFFVFFFKRLLPRSDHQIACLLENNCGYYREKLHVNHFWELNAWWRCFTKDFPCCGQLWLTFLNNASLPVFLKIVFPAQCCKLLIKKACKRESRKLNQSKPSFSCWFFLWPTSHHMGGEPPIIGYFMLVLSTFVSFIGSYMYQHVKQDDLIELLRMSMRYQIQTQFYIDSRISLEI